MYTYLKPPFAGSRIISPPNGSVSHLLFLTADGQYHVAPDGNGLSIRHPGISGEDPSVNNYKVGGLRSPSAR
ncbi:MAG: hypothetical protein P1P83_09455 [Bacteroidales bacterium]|nr:hypothetical protein [Bacteroidales bacterium]MDT8374773.1 hypothetical protein [Bacteroidales bacterium]